MDEEMAKALADVADAADETDETDEQDMADAANAADEKDMAPGQDEPDAAPAERKGFACWARRNRKYLIAAGAGLAVGAATVAIIKEREKIAAVAEAAGKAAEQGYRKAAGKVADSKAVKASAEALGNLAEKASVLVDAGRKVGKSVGDIRELLADERVAEVLPHVKDVLPQVGKLAGALAKAALQVAAKTLLSRK